LSILREIGFRGEEALLIPYRLFPDDLDDGVFDIVFLLRLISMAVNPFTVFACKVSRVVGPQPRPLKQILHRFF